MTLQEAYEKRRLEVLDLTRQVRKLQKELDKAGEGLFTPAEKAELVKENNALSRQLKATEKERDRYRQMWREAHDHNTEDVYKRIDAEREVTRLQEENRALHVQIGEQQKKLAKMSAGLYTSEEKVALLKKKCDLERQLKTTQRKAEHYKRMWNGARERLLDRDFGRARIEEENARLKEENESLKARLKNSQARQDLESEGKIQALSNEVARLHAILNNDGTNSGTPTSRTPLNKKKVVPNSRQHTGKKRGGQPGHVKASLSAFPEGEVTENVSHALEACPDCGAPLEENGERIKDEIDYEVKVIKRRHHFVEYICPCCGKACHTPIPTELKEPVQYGPNIQTTALALLNLGFVSVSRSACFLTGLLEGTSPCEGYIINLQKRYSKQLQEFVAEIREYCLTSTLLFWDDTVVFINTKRGCMRFYGNERVALYKAHAKKDRAGLDEDNILAALGPGTVVMHDHNTVNYNADFCFYNVECNQHLERDLQKLVDVSLHKWPAQLKELIQITIHERKLIILKNGFSFSEDVVQNFYTRFNAIMQAAAKEYNMADNPEFSDDERRLITRLQKYRDNYFRWVEDFSIPTSNNLSERSLRMVKCHEKVSGQFFSVKTAGFFADIRTYLETCLRNGVNQFQALKRLTSGQPYTLSELLCGV